MNQLSVVTDDPVHIDDRLPDEPEPREPRDAQRSKFPQLAWDEGDSAAINYRKLGIVLAKSGDLFCRSGYEGGLLLVRPDGSSKSITTAADLAPVGLFLSGRSVPPTDLPTLLTGLTHFLFARPAESVPPLAGVIYRQR